MCSLQEAGDGDTPPLPEPIGWLVGAQVRQRGEDMTDERGTSECHGDVSVTGTEAMSHWALMRWLDLSKSRA